MKTKYMTGAVTGAFDILHPGYIRLFKEAKEICEYLIVFLHTDPSIENNKPKPVFSVRERIEILRELKCIDDILIYETEEELRQLFLDIKPGVRFLGSDYRNKPVTGSDLTIPTYYVERNHDWSETKVRHLISDDNTVCLDIEQDKLPQKNNVYS